MLDKTDRHIGWDVTGTDVRALFERAAGGWFALDADALEIALRARWGDRIDNPPRTDDGSPDRRALCADWHILNQIRAKDRDMVMRELGIAMIDGERTIPSRKGPYVGTFVLLYP